MAIPATDLEITAALCENVYRRDPSDQAITFSDIGVQAKSVTGTGLTGDPNADGYYYNNANGFVGSVTEKLGASTVYVTFRGTDNSGGFGDVVDDLFTSPLEWAGFSTPGSGGHSDPGDFNYANTALGSGTLIRTQLDDALALARAAIAQNPGKQIVITGQSLGGGLAGLVTAILSYEGFAVSSYAYAAAPFQDQLQVESSIYAVAAILGKTHDEARIIMSGWSDAGLSVIDALKGTDAQVRALYQINMPTLSAAGLDLLVASRNAILANLEAKLSQNTAIHTITGEALSSGIIGGTIDVFADHFNDSVTGYDLGITSPTIGESVALHGPFLHNIVVRTEGGPEKISKLFREDAAFRDALLAHGQIAGSMEHDRADPSASTSKQTAGGPNTAILYNALWKSVGDANGLYSYFYKVFDELMKNGAAADGLSATSGPDPLYPTLHDSIVRIAFGILRDLLQNTSSLTDAGAILAKSFAGGTAPGSTFADKVVLDRTVINQANVAGPFSDYRIDPAKGDNWGVGDVEYVAFKAAYDVVQELGGNTSLLFPILTGQNVGTTTSLLLDWKVVVSQAGSSNTFKLDYDATTTASAQFVGGKTKDGVFVKDASHLVFGGVGDDTITGSTSDDFLIGGNGGGSGKDWIEGRQGKDVIVGGTGPEIDTASYANSTGSVTINFDPAQSVERQAAILRVTNDGYGAAGSEDILIGIERVELTKQSDYIAFGSNMSMAAKELPRGLILDGGDELAAAQTNPTLGDTLDFSLASNRVILKNAADGSKTSELYEKVNSTDKGTGLKFSNFEYVEGSAFDDVLNLSKISPGGEATPAEQTQIDAAWASFYSATAGTVSMTTYWAARSALIAALNATRPYQEKLQVDGGNGVDFIRGNDVGTSIVHGGNDTDFVFSGDYGGSIYGDAGTDLVVGGGIESHLYGGAGTDVFVMTNNTFVEDADAGEFAMWAGFRLSGGVQQSWMENGFAYWTPATSVVAGALGAFGGVFAVAATLFDTVTMTTFRYALSETGQLVVQFGRGRGGQAVVEDYSLDPDCAVGKAGITVFKQALGKATIADLKEYIKAALAAGGMNPAFNSDPLVLDLDGDGLELTRQTNGIYFEMDSDGFAEKTAWVKSDDAFLVRDLNGNGSIDNIGEMFGNATTSGFTALKTYADSNNDNKINSLDTNFSQLKIWRDLDGDGVTDAGELQTLTAAGIKEISVASTTLTNQFIRGNSIRAEATFTRTDNTTSKIADVGLEVNETDSKYLGNATISAPALALPELKGYGAVTGLRIAMTNKAALLTDVTNFKNLAATTDWATLKANAQAILFKWAGVEGVTATSMGGGTFDRQKLAFLETFEGYQLTPRDGGGVPSETNLSKLITSWNDIVEKETIRLALQGPLKTTFSGLSYDAAKDRIVATTATGVADALKAAILSLSSTASTAQTQWNTNWGPLFNELLDSTDRADGNSVRADYTVQSLVKALDGTTTALTLSQFVTGLSLTGVQVGTSAANTLNRVDADGLQVYVGDGGNDTINGGYGQDVYVYGRSFGQDTINDVDSGDAGDRIRFAVYNPEDLNFKRVGLDLVIEVKNSTDKITIKDQFETPEVSLGGIQISADKGIEEIQFADGRIFDMGEVAAATGLGTSGNDTLVGTGTADELEGLQGTDLLQGGDNGDTYYYGRGYGADTIQDVMTNPLLSASDALVMLNGLSAKDVQITRVGASDDVTLSIIGSPGDSVTIKDQFMYTPLGYQTAYAIDNRIEAIFFTIGASWSWTDLQAATIETYTTSGNDTTYGFGTADKFYTSAGNDTLVGFDGGDTYYADRGTGNDTIWDQSRYPDSFIGTLLGYSWAKDDKVVFASGITQADVSFTRLGAAPDLTITIAGSTDTLTIKDQFKGEKIDIFGFFPITWFSRIETFEFSDGSSLNWEQILQKVTTGTAAAESLYGAYYTDTMDGKGGNDYLSGGDEGDTYLFARGYGQDTIEDNQTNVLTTTQDTLKFMSGIAVGDVTFTRTGAGLDLLVTISGGTDSVLLKNEFDFLETGVFGTQFFDRIERFEWADGTVKDINTIVQQLITSGKTSGNDTIYGTYGSETLDGGAGNDYLDGQAGSDIYIKNRNEGNDTIHETNNAYFTTDQDIVRFGTGIATTDISFSRYGTNNWGLTLTLNASGGSISIDDQFKVSLRRGPPCGYDNGIVSVASFGNRRRLFREYVWG